MHQLSAGFLIVIILHIRISTFHFPAFGLYSGAINKGFLQLSNFRCIFA